MHGEFIQRFQLSAALCSSLLFQTQWHTKCCLSYFPSLVSSLCLLFDSCSPSPSSRLKTSIIRLDFVAPQTLTVICINFYSGRLVNKTFFFIRVHPNVLSLFSFVFFSTNKTGLGSFVSCINSRDTLKMFTRFISKTFI